MKANGAFPRKALQVSTWQICRRQTWSKCLTAGEYW
jgi:hypothetical protein